MKQGRLKCHDCKMRRASVKVIQLAGKGFLFVCSRCDDRHWLPWMPERQAALGLGRG